MMYDIVGHDPGVAQVCRIEPLAFCRNERGHWYLVATIVCKAPGSTMRLAEHIEGPEDEDPENQAEAASGISRAQRRQNRRRRRRQRIRGAFRKLGSGVKKVVTSPQFQQLATMAATFSGNPAAMAATRALGQLRQRDPDAARQLIQGSQVFDRAQQMFGRRNMAQAMDFMREARSAGAGSPESLAQSATDMADRIARNDPEAQDVMVKVCEQAENGNPHASRFCALVGSMYTRRYLTGQRGYHRRDLVAIGAEHCELEADEHVSGSTWQWLRDTFGIHRGITDVGPFRDAYRDGLQVAAGMCGGDYEIVGRRRRFRSRLKKLGRGALRGAFLPPGLGQLAKRARERRRSSR